MHRDHGGGIEEEGAFHDLAWVYGSAIDCPVLLHLIGDQVVFRSRKRKRGPVSAREANANVTSARARSLNL